MKPALWPNFSTSSDGILSPSVEGFVGPFASSAARLCGIARVADMAGISLLMLTVGTLLFRPADFIPALADQPIYECLIAACSLASFPRLFDLLRASSLRNNAITSLLLLLVPAIMLSHLSHANTYDARISALFTIKACVLFLLVLANVTSTERFKRLLWVIGIGVFAMTILAILQYHGLIYLSALRSIEQPIGDAKAPGMLLRLCGIGVFNDPNDYSLILVFAMVVCTYGLSEQWSRRGKLGFVLALGVFGYALILTHSRGGMLSAVGALSAFLVCRFGWRNAVPLAILILPVLLIVAGGRQTSVDIDNPEDTFQTRLDLWYQSFDAFRSAPLLGIGAGKLVDLVGQVSHNSFLQAFAEMGLFGGIAFLGCFYLATRGLWRASCDDSELARLRPFVLAIVFGYGAGLLSLSRCYVVPTYLVLAIATTYLVLASARGNAALPRWNWRCVRRVAIVGCVFLAATYLFVRVMLQQGHA